MLTLYDARASARAASARQVAALATIVAAHEVALAFYLAWCVFGHGCVVATRIAFTTLALARMVALLEHTLALYWAHWVERTGQAARQLRSVLTGSVEGDGSQYSTALLLWPVDAMAWHVRLDVAARELHLSYRSFADATVLEPLLRARMLLPATGAVNSCSSAATTARASAARCALRGLSASNAAVRAMRLSI